MGLNDEIGNPFLGGVWQFSVARGGCGEYGIVAKTNLHTWFVSEPRRRAVILNQFPFTSLAYYIVGVPIFISKMILKTH